MLHSVLKLLAVDAIAVSKQKARSVLERKRFDDLLSSPLGSRVCRHVEVDDATTIMPHDQKDGENSIVWPTPGNLGGGYGTDLDPEITYDLGHLVNLTTMRIWNYNSSLPVGATNISIVGPDQVEVLTSSDGVSFSSQGTVNFAQSPGANGYAGQDIAVSYANTRFVKFDIKTNHDGAVFDGTGAQPGVIDGRSLTGLSEVRFEGAPVDEVTIRPFVAQVSSQNPIGINRLATHTADVSGLAGIGKAGDTHINVADPGFIWTTVGNFGPAPATDLDPFITYDLGGPVNLKTIRIWNDNSAGLTHLGRKDVEIFAGPTLASMTSRGTIALDPASGLPTCHGEDHAVDYAGVRYVKFDIKSNLAGARCSTARGRRAGRTAVT